MNLKSFSRHGFQCSWIAEISARFIVISFLILTALLLVSKDVKAEYSLPPEYQYLCNTYSTQPFIVCFPSTPGAVWVDTVQEVAEQECRAMFPIGHVFAYFTITGCEFVSSEQADGVVPYIKVAYSGIGCGYWSSPNCSAPVQTNIWPFKPFTRSNPARYFVKPTPPPNSEASSCCQNSVGHPISPSSGSVIDTVNDLRQGNYSVGFDRHYDSFDASKNGIGVGWNQSYSRRIVAKYSALTTQLHVALGGNSSAYADAASACVSGFGEVQSSVPSWSGATALYVEGNCQLTKGGVTIGYVPMYYTRQSLPLASASVAYEVVRDDGQVVRFTVSGGAIAVPPGTSLKLVKTANDYTLTDGNDTVETYDATGKLLIITNRAGVVQTMAYDGSGRLSSVVDNFGHQLTLGYDTQNRLISVTRQ